ncbi:hypothetical protein ACI3LY_002899 [Candidozyma auris]|uniref:Yippee domain-containing protein n=2 Tax=Candidozyma auris TaxID=498019 RepID=A0AB36W5J0_CANAR|nr:hypothetical protein QG37_04777 [[Candida] auris]PIS51984.1 hypothetical protein B9J08_003595 [[Candida] auris]PIS53970.1 hypothetical protein CJI97_003668 [[Candida] auris]PSK75116.1 hypothetical protein CJJ07_005105 [[Candida] auris]QEL58474.1 hypothetical protein CJJ09_000510 [[Candida] auris]
MGLKSTEFFENTSYDSKNNKIFVCNECSSHLCLSNLVISDQFTGASGPAYLVDKLINVQPMGPDQEKQFRTGIYVVNDICCSQCHTTLGWFYKKSAAYAEQYKEGKYVVERAFIREVPNHTSTASLLQQARSSRRRRSSANSATSSFDDESSLESFRRRRSDEFKFGSVHVKLDSSSSSSPSSNIPHPRAARGSHSSSSRFVSVKDEFDEHDEDQNVFVDA